MSADNDNPSTPAHTQNKNAWDRMVREGQRFTKPAKDEDFRDPLGTVDAAGWLGGNIFGQSVLCLAAGGGRQSALYAAAGGKVTVVDISPAMLELDREVANERKLDVTTVEASMDYMPMFGDSQFDIVIHPVSSCYVPNIRKIYAEVARVIRPGGIYISQHKTPTSLQAGMTPTGNGYELCEPYYREGPLPPVKGTRLREEGTLEYLHRWEEIVGGMCRAGFVVEDMVEPVHAKADADDGSFGHRGTYIAPYVRIKARRIETNSQTPATDSGLWLPR